jgi:hypothetical protein
LIVPPLSMRADQERQMTAPPTVIAANFRGELRFTAITELTASDILIRREQRVILKFLSQRRWPTHEILGFLP